MEIFESFNVFDYFPVIEKLNIRCFYATYFGEIDDKKGYNAYCVTNGNQVYGLGYSLKIEGYNNHDNHFLIKELCDKNINQFFRGYYTMFALSDNEVFYWTQIKYPIKYHELLNYKDHWDEFSKPLKIDYFDDKNIVQIGCTLNCCLALSADGTVYCSSITDLIQNNSLFMEYFSLNYKNDMIRSFCSSQYGRVYLATFSGNIHKLHQSPAGFSSKHIENLNSIQKLTDKFGQEYVITDLWPNDLREGGWIMKINSKTSENEKFYFIKFDFSEVLCIEEIARENIFEYFCKLMLTYKTIHIVNNRLFAFDMRKDNENFFIIKELKEINLNPKLLKDIQISFAKKLEKILEKNIKCYSESINIRVDQDDPIILVTNENKVYARLKDSVQQHSVDKNISIVDKTEKKIGNDFENMKILEKYKGFESISVFDGQIIDNFFFGDHGLFVIIEKNKQRQVYHLESNSYSPERLEYFNNKNIIEISCGKQYYLALSENGIVYAWIIYKKPLILNEMISENTKAKYIHCKENLSFIITTDGEAYVFNQKSSDTMCAQLSAIHKVKKVLYLAKNIYVLTEQGQLVKYIIEDKDKDKVLPIQNIKNVQDMFLRRNEKLLAECEDCVYIIEPKNMTAIKTEFLNHYDYWLSNFTTIHQETIHVARDGLLQTKFYEFNEKYISDPTEPIFKLVYRNIFERKYVNEFDTEKAEKIYEVWGREVWDVRHKNLDHNFAVKIIELSDSEESHLNEIRIMSDINSEFTVKYFKSWIECEVKFKRIKKYLFIQMELCSQDLQKFLDSFKDLIEDISNKEVDYKNFFYFLSCTIFRELAVCLNYLHDIGLNKLVAPIIHRDLKPGNVLISNELNPKLKLSDFGLSIPHKESNHSINKGTLLYIAPEVRYGTKYNCKADIYSLGLIATQIFNFEDKIEVIKNDKNKIFKNLEEYREHDIPDDKLDELGNLIEKCLLEGLVEDSSDMSASTSTQSNKPKQAYNLRPSCNDIIYIIDKININKSNLIMTKEFLLEVKKLNDCPFKKYCEIKLK